MEGKGVAEKLDGLWLDEDTTSSDRVDAGIQTESVKDQEKRESKHASTIPRDDPGPLPGGTEIGIYALGLQEIVDINSAAEALRPYTDPATGNKFKKAMEAALPPGYLLLAEQQLIGLLLLVYASPEIASVVSCVSTTSVGTGLMGYMGNKGATTARLLLGETTRLVFVNSHLSAGTDKGALERRNWDAGQILARTKFDPIPDVTGLVQPNGESIGSADFAFWFGDLNYRLEGIPGEDVRRLLTLHVNNAYGREPTNRERGAHQRIIEKTTSSNRSSMSNDSQPSSTTSTVTPSELSEENLSANLEDVDPNSDPASLQTTISSLLPHDELLQQQKLRKCFHDGWKEGRIAFLPTYKFDVGTVGRMDSSDKRRGPSWCDRILYRTRRDKLAYEKRNREEEEAKRREEGVEAKGPNQGTAGEELLFDYDPETDAVDGGSESDYDDQADVPADTVLTKNGFQDELHLETYTAHHRVLSSDHKPLDATFTLKYDAVDPNLKAKVLQEVAKELDKQENEGRPRVTIVVDKYHGVHGHHNDGGTDENAIGFEGVHFGEVRYAKTKLRTITIANTGQVPTTFGFVDRPLSYGEDAGPSPRWLSICFDEGAKEAHATEDAPLCYTLNPGETCSASLALRVDDINHVRRLNEGLPGLQDILVLRVINGRDHFLPIHAKWLPSSFGSSIDRLVRLPEGGIRRLQNQRPVAKTCTTRRLNEEDTVLWSAPREILRLTEAIEGLVERVLAKWSMTRRAEDSPWTVNAGWPFDPESWTLEKGEERDDLLDQVREAIDTDKKLDAAPPSSEPPLYRLEALCEVLMDFLDTLEDGVITVDLWARVENCLPNHDKARQYPTNEEEHNRVMEALALSSGSHHVSFIFLTSMLRRIIIEVANAADSSGQDEVESKDKSIPSPPKASRLRRNILSKIPRVARRQLMSKSYADIFADIIVKAPKPAREKALKVKRSKKQHFLELFITPLDEK